jgi:16S rRNA C967 or C1407 C5-methylase (RsmB/RsmF family)
MQTLLGNEYSNFLEALRCKPPVSVRYNEQKMPANCIASAAPIAWCAQARYLPERPEFVFDPIFHAGGYYVQEASSMLIAHIVRQLFTNPVCALDLCASPGGKTTLLAQTLPPQSIVVANEAIAHRATVLAENTAKWGTPNILVCQNDPQVFANLPPVFDLMMVDAPCSGEGMFRKDPQAQDLWNPNLVRLCAARQRRIVADAWGALKDGGTLIYSTCTFNTEENEQNVHWFVENLDAECVEIAFDASWNIMPSCALHSNTYGVAGYRCFPHRVAGEGFFVAVLRKNAGATLAVAQNNWCGRKQPRTTTKYAAPMQQWLTHTTPVVFEEHSNNIYVFTHLAAQMYFMLKPHLRFLLLGQHFGTAKGGKIIPEISLALSTMLCGSAFVQNDLSRSDALSYLSRTPIQWNSTGSKGFELATYGGLPLGFVNNMGTRYNNLFPLQWRIRKQMDNQVSDN